MHEKMLDGKISIIMILSHTGVSTPILEFLWLIIAYLSTSRFGALKWLR